MWILKSLDPEQPFTFRLLPGSIKTLGRAHTVDFVVDAALVSRVHCRFTLDERGLGIEDLGSTNGDVGERPAHRSCAAPGGRHDQGRTRGVHGRPRELTAARRTRDPYSGHTVIFGPFQGSLLVAA